MSTCLQNHDESRYDWKYLETNSRVDVTHEWSICPKDEKVYCEAVVVLVQIAICPNLCWEGVAGMAILVRYDAGAIS